MLTKLEQEDSRGLECEITEGEVSVTLNILRLMWLLDREVLEGLSICFFGNT